MPRESLEVQVVNLDHRHETQLPPYEHLEAATRYRTQVNEHSHTRPPASSDTALP